MPLDGERDEPTVQEAAQRVAAASALLPGENPTSPFLDDAVHWCTVYEELLGFKQGLLSQMRKNMEAMTVDGLGEVELDTVLLGHQANRYRLRLSFWEERRRQLSGELPG